MDMAVLKINHYIPGPCESKKNNVSRGGVKTHITENLKEGLIGVKETAEGWWHTPPIPALFILLEFRVTGSFEDQYGKNLCTVYLTSSPGTVRKSQARC